MAKDRPPYGPGSRLGERVRGQRKYGIVDVLGAGGMGVVYEAIDSTCDREVAIKIIRPSMARSERYSEGRLDAEVKALVQIRKKSDAVVDVLTAGITDDQHALPYYVTERLYGKTMQEAIAHQRDNVRVDFTIDEVLGMSLPIALAIMRAHELGIVHRDIKPSNAFLASVVDDRIMVKVLDFGICAPVALGRLANEHPGHFVGSPPYASVEQLLGHAPALTMDVYSFGLLLYELLTFTLPPARTRRDLGPRELATVVLVEAIPSIAERRPDIPSQLVDLVSRCLELEPAALPSMHDIARELDHITRQVERARFGEMKLSISDTEPGDPHEDVRRYQAEVAAEKTRRTRAVPMRFAPHEHVIGDEAYGDPMRATEPPEPPAPSDPGSAVAPFVQRGDWGVSRKVPLAPRRAAVKDSRSGERILATPEGRKGPSPMDPAEVDAVRRALAEEGLPEEEIRRVFALDESSYFSAGAVGPSSPAPVEPPIAPMPIHVLGPSAEQVVGSAPVGVPGMGGALSSEPAPARPLSERGRTSAGAVATKAQANKVYIDSEQARAVLGASEKDRRPAPPRARREPRALVTDALVDRAETAAPVEPAARGPAARLVPWQYAAASLALVVASGGLMWWALVAWGPSAPAAAAAAVTIAAPTAAAPPSQSAPAPRAMTALSASEAGTTLGNPAQPSMVRPPSIVAPIRPKPRPSSTARLPDELKEFKTCMDCPASPAPSPSRPPVPRAGDARIRDEL